MEQNLSESKPREAIILRQILQTSSSMTGWLKFLGIINIISGALTALSLWGIIIAWLPIWLGILLLQASQRITNARFANSEGELVGMMEKLRLYFIIQGVLIIVSFAVGIIALVVFGGLIFQMMQGGGLDTF
jgi:hypothetical protein